MGGIIKRRGRDGRREIEERIIQAEGRQMTGVGKDDGGMERGEKAQDGEKKRIKTNREMTHFLYGEKATQ